MRSSRAVTSPIAVAIEPTNICNLRCPLCVVGAGELKRPSGVMTFDRFAHIIDMLPGRVTTLYLWGQGEPFIAPDLLRMVSYAGERGLRTIVSTNGHYLTDTSDILASGLTRLIVSLDGMDAATYASYRVGGDFDRVIRDIGHLVEDKQRTGRGPVIELQYLVTRENCGSLADVRAFGRSLGVDRVVYKTLQATWLPGGESNLPDDMRLTRYRRNPDGTLAPDRHPYIGNRCLRLYYSFQIDWQGNVVPCCFDKNSEYVLGNVFDRDLRDIWNGEAYRMFRDTMNRLGRHLPMCADCSEGLKRMYVHV